MPRWLHPRERKRNVKESDAEADIPSPSLSLSTPCHAIPSTSLSPLPPIPSFAARGMRCGRPEVFGGRDGAFALLGQQASHYRHKLQVALPTTFCQRTQGLLAPLTTRASSGCRAHFQMPYHARALAILPPTQPSASPASGQSCPFPLSRKPRSPCNMKEIRRRPFQQRTESAPVSRLRIISAPTSTLASLRSNLVTVVILACPARSSREGTRRGRSVIPREAVHPLSESC